MDPIGQFELGLGVPGLGARARAAGLDVLKEVQRMYEEKLDLIERQGGVRKLELQVELLRSWVSDLASQNALLAGVVEELEREATTRLISERRNHQERDSKKDRCDALNESKTMHDSLQQENVAKDREIRKLNKEVQQFEQTIMNLRAEISQCKYKTDIPRKDVEVMVGFCCHGNEEARTLRAVNTALSSEAAALRRMAAALHQQLRAAAARAHFKDDIIREMRRQLKQAKHKLKSEGGSMPSQSSSRWSLALAEGSAPALPQAQGRAVSAGGRLRRPRAVRRESAPRLEIGSDSDVVADCNLDGSGGDHLA